MLRRTPRKQSKRSFSTHGRERFGWQPAHHLELAETEVQTSRGGGRSPKCREASESRLFRRIRALRTSLGPTIHLTQTTRGKSGFHSRARNEQCLHYSYVSPASTAPLRQFRPLLPAQRLPLNPFDSHISVIQAAARRSWGASCCTNVAEEARHCGFAFLDFARFAFY